MRTPIALIAFVIALLVPACSDVSVREIECAALCVEGRALCAGGDVDVCRATCERGDESGDAYCTAGRAGDCKHLVSLFLCDADASYAEAEQECLAHEPGEDYCPM